MAEKDIIQNMISQLGQSQDARMPKELGIHFADVDERTAQDFLTFVKNFAPLINYYRNSTAAVTGNWANFFPKDDASIVNLLAENDASVQPHLALFLTLLEIYQQPQGVINQITGRHLDFYYQQVLQLAPKRAVPDKAHVLLELKKQASPASVGVAEIFSAGKDRTGAELIYTPTSQTVINASKVDSLRSLFVDKTGNGTIRYAPIANSSDGAGGKLDANEPKWHGFGSASLSAAEVGFALASPVLRMQEGTRKVTVKLTLQNVNATKLNNTALDHAFNVFITGETGWLGPYPVSPTLSSDGVFQFSSIVPDTEKAVVDYNVKTHGYNYSAQAPVIQVLLNTGSTTLGYNDFAGVGLAKVQISISVSGITSLDLESDTGTLDPTKAFAPFGSQPTKGSLFMVGYDEALAKKLSRVELALQWKGAPANFATYYTDYGKSVSNDYFTATISFKDGGSWEYSSSAKLFESSDASQPHTLTFSAGTASVATNASMGMNIFALSQAGSNWAMAAANKYVLMNPVFLPFKTAGSESRSGFITFSLNNDFLHSTYRTEYVRKVMTYSKSGGTLTILNEPYTPMIQSISLTYDAYTDEVDIAAITLEDFANSDVQFFHLAYFGQMREQGYQRQQFDFLLDKSVSLLPAYKFEGELLIGFTNLNANDSVSVLFQVADGSADPDFSQEKISWFVLCDNYWKPLGTSEVVLDTTNQLLASGIIKFVIPAEATTTNTILPTGRLWLRAAVAQNVTAVCQLIDVQANAVETQFTDNGNDPNHLATALAAGTIKKLKNGLSAVKTVSQPFASFGGSAVESSNAFYTRVSERLRHKDRCITPWDYERIILEAFPKVHRVKCIPHAKEGSWLAPGYVMIVVVPDLKNKNAVDPLQPKVDADTISRITTWVLARAGMQVLIQDKHPIKVKNPSYQRIQLSFNVKFLTGYEYNFYSQQLNQQLIELLSPWAYQADRDISFGGKIYKSVLLDFVEDCGYVDYVTDFKMYSYTGNTNNFTDVNEALPETPDAILVSDYSHVINEVS